MILMMTTSSGQGIYFEDINIGESLPSREHGPLTIVDTVRWAGLQENWQHLHFDRDHVRQHNGLRAFIASGAYRQALLIRMLTDWIGPRGWLKKISVRHTYSTFEGDLMRFGGRVVDKSADAADPWIACEIEGHNQESKQILVGRCTLSLPGRTGKFAR
jgi:acyl dehydratase